MNKSLLVAFALLGLVTLTAASCGKPADTTPNLAVATSVAEWLTQSGVKMYGAFWCPHCTDQKKIFGTAFEKINYIECSTPDGRDQLPVCKEAGINTYPTWELKSGERIEGVLSLEQLKEKTNYKESGPQPPQT